MSTHRQRRKGIAELMQTFPNVKLAEVCDINPRREALRRSDNARTTFVPMAAIDATRGVIGAPEIRQFNEVKRGYTSFRESDVLFAKITPCMQNGKHAVARDLIDGIGFGSTEFHVLRATKYILPEWIHLFLRNERLLNDAVKHFSGSVGQQRLPEQYLAELSIALPPLDVQRDISSTIYSQLEMVYKCEELAQSRHGLTIDLPKSILSDTFARLAKAERRALADLCVIVSGSTPPTGTSQYWGGENIWITPSDLGSLREMEITTSKRKITDSGVSAANLRVVPAGATILSTRASIGHIGIASQPLFLGMGCKGFAANERIDSHFLFWAIKSAIPRIRDLARGTTFREVSRTDLAELRIPLPPMPEQAHIARTLSHNTALCHSMQMQAGDVQNSVVSLRKSITSLIGGHNHA